MANEPTVEAPTYYNSSYQHGVDEKRRVQIPAKWRPADPEVEFTLIVWPENTGGACLRVLPPKEMAKLMLTIDAMPASNKVSMKRFIGENSIQVAVDKAGRICLPEPMAKAAGISDQALLVGLLDRFEIWNPERYAPAKASAAVVAQEAFKLME